MQGRKQHTEKLFLSFQLSEHVPEDNFYRKLKNLLDLRWLYKATAKYYGTEGQQSIDPVVFFKLILIGYLENLGSDRRIINTAAMRLDMLFFVGHDLDEPLPWHSTLSRTRQLYGEDVFKQLFKQVLKQCIDKGMVAGKRQAIDSVFVKANASMSSLVEKDILDDGDTYTATLTQDDIATPIKSIDNKDHDTAANTTVSASKNKRVQQHHSWKKKAYKGMPGARVNPREVDKDEEKYERSYVSNHTHYSTTDADARVSVKPGKPRQLNYLGQVSTDTANHVITNIEAHHADKKDSQCLPSVLNNTIDNLHNEGLVVEEVLADTAYSSGEALKALDEKNIVGYIPNFGQYKATR
jgi:transposase